MIDTKQSKAQPSKGLNTGKFWLDKRVMVTGGSGFLGSHLVHKLETLNVAEVIVPRKEEYDLRDIQAVRQLITDTTEGVCEGQIVWDTSKPNGQPRRKLDTRRAQEYFSFDAHTNFLTGLQNTIEWFYEQPSDK